MTQSDHSWYPSLLMNASNYLQYANKTANLVFSGVNAAYNTYLTPESDSDTSEHRMILSISLDRFQAGPLLALSACFTGWQIDTPRFSSEQTRSNSAFVSNLEPAPVSSITLLHALPKCFPVKFKYAIAVNLYVPPLDGSLNLDNIESYSSSPVVTLYAVSKHQKAVFHSLKFDIPILTLRSSSRFLVSMGQDSIFILDSHSLEESFRISGDHGPLGTLGCLALGTRFLAYPAREPQQLTPSSCACADRTSCQACSTHGNGARDVVSEVAKSMVKGLTFIGNTATKTYSYLAEGALNLSSAPESTSLPSNTSAKKAGMRSTEGDDASEQATEHHHGSIIVVDLYTRTPVANFQTDDGQLSFLTFDPSGLLLVAVSDHGRHLNIFQIQGSSESVLTPKSNAIPLELNAKRGNDVFLPERAVLPVCRHLYQLHRGVTSARIVDVHVSCDSRWLCALSERGTVHIYAINPAGGPILPDTHTQLGTCMSQLASGSDSVAMPLVFPAGVHLPCLGSGTSIHRYPFQMWKGAMIPLTVVDRIHEHNGLLSQIPGVSSVRGSMTDRSHIRMSVRIEVHNPHLPYSNQTSGMQQQNQLRSDSTGPVTRLRIALVTSTASILFYSLIPKIKSSKDGSAAETLTLHSEANTKKPWKIRPVSPNILIDDGDNVQSLQARHQQPHKADLKNSKQQDSGSVRDRAAILEETPTEWLSEIEVDTCISSSLPLWRCPQFEFSVFDPEFLSNPDVLCHISPRTASSSSARFYMTEHLPVRSLESCTEQPAPYPTDAPIFVTNTTEPSNIEPSAPPLPEIKNGIAQAMTTPLPSKTPPYRTVPHVVQYPKF
eukprot:TRINITY_DN198_c0_g1::TRINITY_DN198_c0_g1_i1::g.14329::m.14329 TRINITY_DN198_c0_g1::TRINITY_DN198_c0_g1_i1::g.14329  ORF type:complete len:834 (+),score=11.13,sp/Q8H1Q5/AT18H_ARATH/29.58/1e-24,BCAS3/PF12490.3/1.5e-05 TRINITY_DN198_c0_g1_i1:123-2624(+)